MVRVVGKEEALGVGVDGNCSSGIDGSKKTTRRYPGRSFYCFPPNKLKKSDARGIRTPEPTLAAFEGNQNQTAGATGYSNGRAM